MSKPTFEFLDGIREELREEFDQNRRVMTFEDYLELFVEAPALQARSAAQYLLDMFHHFGSERSDGPLGRQRRWRVFDAPFEAGRDKLVGQEAVQEAIYRIVSNFTRQRRVNKLVLLHGPNGSAKSSTVACVARGLEAYSQEPQGALYCFNWVFPSKKVSKSRLGFGGEDRPQDPTGSFALLSDEDVDGRIAGDLRDHPLLLLPTAHRQRLLAEHLPADYLVPDTLWSGELAPRNRQIFDLLYNGYRGDIARVLQHVQVERFFISRRYRRGTVTVEPQLHVDASVRQLTGDRSLSSLPLALQSTTLYEPFGDLVDAHRGLIEYNDLLKRPVDSYKYLLSTSEKSTVALSNQILHLDLVLFASSNETHLSAFKGYADWPSFKARIELVRVPYLRCYRTERQIYDDQLPQEPVGKRIAPHTTFVAALWAVLTRMSRPNPERYPKELRGTMAKLTPLQKAELYSSGRVPSGLPIEKTRLLRAHIATMAEESLDDSEYEGRTGASPREMKVTLLNAAQREEFPTLSPLAVLAQIRELVAQKTVYAFLQQDPDGQYHDHAAFIDVVKDRWLDQADDELHRAMGLVTRDQYDELFGRYLMHVAHQGRSEKIRNPVTGDFEEPDERFMGETEDHFSVEGDRSAFRSQLLGRIAAASGRDRTAGPDYRELFPDLFEQLEDSYYQAQRPTIRKIALDLLRLLGGEGGLLSSSDRRRAEDTLQHLRDDFGYCDDSAKETVSLLLAERHTE